MPHLVKWRRNKLWITLQQSMDAGYNKINNSQWDITSSLWPQVVRLPELPQPNKQRKKVF